MNSVSMLFVISFGGAVFYSVAAFWLLEVQELFGPSYKEIARNLVALGFAFLLGICLVGWGITFSRGQIREIFIISASLMTAGTGAMIAINENTSGLSIGLSFLAGLGIGGVYIPSVVVLTLLSADNLIGTVVGFALSIRFIAGNIGYAIYYNVFYNRLVFVLPKNVIAAVIPAGLPQASAPSFVSALLTKNLTLIAEVKGVTPKVILAAQEAVLNSYVDGFSVVYYVAIGFGGVTIIASFFLGNIRDYMDERVAVDIH
jgi:Fungal trichothecene efflux pump (TRI12)